MNDTATKPQDWLVRQLNQFTRDSLRGYPWRCRDGACGASDCPRCSPECMGRKPLKPEYDDSHEPGFTD